MPQCSTPPHPLPLPPRKPPPPRPPNPPPLPPPNPPPPPKPRPPPLPPPPNLPPPGPPRPRKPPGPPLPPLPPPRPPPRPPPPPPPPVKRESGSNFSELMYTLSSALKDLAFTPESGLTVKNTCDTRTKPADPSALESAVCAVSPGHARTWLMGPKISSILPTLVLFSRKMPALKYGMLSLVSLHSISPSTSCTNVPASADQGQSGTGTIINLLVAGATPWFPLV